MKEVKPPENGEDRAHDFEVRKPGDKYNVRRKIESLVVLMLGCSVLRMLGLADLIQVPILSSSWYFSDGDHLPMIEPSQALCHVSSSLCRASHHHYIRVLGGSSYNVSIDMRRDGYSTEPKPHKFNESAPGCQVRGDRAAAGNQYLSP